MKVLKAFDWLNIARIYIVIFGLRGIVFAFDRAVRKLLPGRYYCHTWNFNGPRRYEFLNLDLCIDSDSKYYQSLFPNEKEKIVEAANNICAHKFDVMHSGFVDFGQDINWHQDIKTKHVWSNEFYSEINIEASYNSGTDVKTIWELNRFHHALILARAYWLTNDRTYQKELIDQWLDWISKNPCAYGINWTSSMEVSIRSVNLLFALLIIVAKDRSSKAIPEVLFRNLREHGIYIQRNLEIGSKNGSLISGNHLISNYAALACIGLILPELPESREWVRVGLYGLDMEVKRQILPDGLHYESSLHYHRLVLEMLLITGLLSQKSRHKISPRYMKSVSDMCDAIVVMTRPDGQLPMIGDTDDGRFVVLSGYYLNRLDDHRDILSLGAILLDREDLRVLCRDNLRELFWVMGPDSFKSFNQASEKFIIPGFKTYDHAGISVLQNRDQKDFILFRTGWPESGAPTGHRHNDLLSTEIWLKGKPITVDPGTLSYTADFETRNEFRSTKSHATVSLNNNEQNAITLNQPFELIPKTVASAVSVFHGGGNITIACTAYWTNILSHKRSITYSLESGMLTIEDIIIGADEACWNWPLFPGVDEFKATILSDMKLSKTFESFKVATSYGVFSQSKILRLVNKTGKRAFVKFIFNPIDECIKNANEDLLQVS